MRVGLTEQLAGFRQRGLLVEHVPSGEELAQHIDKAARLLADARRSANSLEARFEIANSAGHGLLMAALKMNGHRTTSEKGHRMILYQLLDVLVPGAAGAKETLSRAHNARNKSEYDGDDLDVTEAMVEDLIEGVSSVQEEVRYLFRRFKAR